jgi:hypothetical protein
MGSAAPIPLRVAPGSSAHTADRRADTRLLTLREGRLDAAGDERSVTVGLRTAVDVRPMRDLVDRTSPVTA